MTHSGHDILDAHYLLLTAIVTVGMQLSFFAIAATFKFDKVTDLAGSANFVVLALLTFFLRQTYFTRQIVVTVLVSVWGVRLGSYLLIRVLKRGKDDRFDEIRENFLQFLGFWIFQMLWVWLVSLPVIYLNSFEHDTDLNAADYLGWALWAIGFAFEVLADYTKSAHYEDPDNKGKLLQSNVWSVSRHPNYFGEICLWVGVFISCASTFSDNTNHAWASVISPVFAFVILMFGSGVPLGEARYDKRFGNDPTYVEYKKSTSPLIPMPTSCYKAFPSFLRLFFCEFPMYSKHFQKTTETSHLKSGSQDEDGFSQSLRRRRGLGESR